MAFLWTEFLIGNCLNLFTEKLYNYITCAITQTIYNIRELYIKYRHIYNNKYTVYNVMHIYYICVYIYNRQTQFFLFLLIFLKEEYNRILLVFQHHCLFRRQSLSVRSSLPPITNVLNEKGNKILHKASRAAIHSVRRSFHCLILQDYNKSMCFYYISHSSSN